MVKYQAYHAESKENNEIAIRRESFACDNELEDAKKADNTDLLDKKKKTVVVDGPKCFSYNDESDDFGEDIMQAQGEFNPI